MPAHTTETATLQRDRASAARHRVASLALPGAFITALTALTLWPSIRSNPDLLRSFIGAVVALLLFGAGLLITTLAGRRTLRFEIGLRPQHYLQACAHVSILLYWGWYWREVYTAAPLIAAQLAFAYAFDSLQAWTRRDTYTLGFGPFPIIFSTNLFLWFKPEWFYFQFVMVAVGFAAKEWIRWKKDGRLVHIFNPSSFSLMLCSLVLLVTGATGITWGAEIATTQLNPPHMFLWIFAASLPGQLLFGVASMTWAAVTSAYLAGGMYYLFSGMHFFAERPIPIAVFLGMHLLFTDPSTAPRSELGRLIYGVLYGLAVVGLLALLSSWHLPTFYDKLLPVPILNLSVQLIDRVARGRVLRTLDPARIGRQARPRQRNLAYVLLWALTFATIQGITGEDAVLVRADSLYAQGRVDDSLVRYREFVAARPTDADGHNNYGVALMAVHQLDAAASEFRRAVELKPDQTHALLNLGIALTRAQRAPEAIAPLQKAVQLSPASSAVRAQLGQALIQAGRASEGVAQLQDAASLDPGDADSLDDLGVALMDVGRVSEAVGPLQRAAELARNNPDTLNNLAVALLRDGRAAESVSPLRRAVELDPRNTLALDNLGHALMQTGHIDEAIATFSRRVDVEPESVDAAIGLGVALLFAGRADAALPFLRRAASADDRPESWANLAVALTESGHLADALTAAQRVVELKPSDADAYTGLGEVFLRMGRIDAASEAFSRALQLDPKAEHARAAMAGLVARSAEIGK